MIVHVYFVLSNNQRELTIGIINTCEIDLYMLAYILYLHSRQQCRKQTARCQGSWQFICVWDFKRKKKKTSLTTRLRKTMLMFINGLSNFHSSQMLCESDASPASFKGAMPFKTEFSHLLNGKSILYTNILPLFFPSWRCSYAAPSTASHPIASPACPT